MGKQPRILRVCSYPTDRRPGMGLAVYELADLPGFRTTIFAYRPEPGEQFRPMKNSNVRLVPLTFANPVMPQKRAGVRFLARQLQRLAAILRFNLAAILRSLAETPDIVHIHSPMHVLTAMSGKVRGAVTCLTIHGTDFIRIAESKRLRRSLKSLDVIFCMTHAHEQQLREWYPSKRIVYVANGTDIEFFAAGRAEGSERCKAVVGVGTLRWHKNFSALIRAFSEVAKTDREWQLTILGEGPDRGALSELAGQLGIAERVAMPGSVSREELRDTLQRAAIFVLSSATEGIPKVLLEAMASGCACISTDVGDCREVLGSTGLIVPPADDDRLADALGQLTADRAARQRFSEAAAARSRKYSWTAYGQKYAAAYWQALEDRSAAGRRSA